MNKSEKTAPLIAFTGTHGTGKTTAVFDTAAKLKKENPTQRIGILSEVAGTCPYPINLDATELSQDWIFHTHIHRELDAMQHYDLIVCDRTCVDCISYTWIAGFHDLALAQLAIAQWHVRYYRRIIFRQMDTMEYWYPDKCRESDDAHFRANMQKQLKSLYKRLGARVEYV